MSKLKRLIMCALAVCSVSCLSLGAIACDKSSDFPNFKNPTSSDTPDDTDTPDTPVDGEDAPYSGYYKINVKSIGGLPLDGIRIAAKKNGSTLMEGISSNGVITFALEQGEYELEIVESSLPEGYYIPEDKTFKTTAELANVTVAIPSTIITSTAVGSTRYAIGDVMHDFSFTEVSTGVRHTLSEIFSTKKAVVLNFFYTTCNPCKSEFPALQSAYDNFSDDLAVIALADTSMDPSFDTVAKFKENMELDFYMGQDQAGIGTLFSVSAYPTTVIIDRYGVVAYKHTSSIVSTSVWNSMFAKYTSDDYVQSGVEEDNSGSGNSQELVKPNVEMSSSAAISNAINGEGTDEKVGLYTGETNEEDAEYSWPWIVKTESDGSCITASNISIDNSYANIYTTISLKSGDILSYEYNVKTESGADVLYVLIDREVIASYSGDTSKDSDNGWKTEYAAYIAQRDIKIEFALSYLKDTGDSEDLGGEERASIRNITIVNAKHAEYAVDIYTSAVSGEIDENSGKYTEYAEVVLSPEDNYYHFGGVDGPILFADILNATAWSDLHYGEKTFTNDEGTRNVASLYLFSYWNMSNWKLANKDSSIELAFDYGHTDTIIDNYYWQGFSANGLVPVSEKLKQALIAFTQKYCEKYDKSYYEEQWLELCYYGVHYGAPHIQGEECEIYTDPIKAFDFSNAYDLQLDTLTHVNVDIILKWNNGGGKFYKFVAEKTGIYYFYSDFGDVEADPLTIVYDSEKNIIGEFNDDLSVNMSTNQTPYNFYGYAYFVEGETYYFQCRGNVPGEITEYDFIVTYTGLDEYDYLRVCSTGAGTWSYDEMGTYYLAIDVMLGDDNIYYEVTADGGYDGSKIYIDFVHPTYYDDNGHTIKDIIDRGLFDLGYKDLTATMNAFYEASIKDKDESDELYGIHEATKELVDAICEYLNYTHGEGRGTNYWLVFGLYYQHFGA
ncbi:MAG: TlpA family protein disulfide reductase [Candidatus Coproplasma sp.]